MNEETPSNDKLKTLIMLNHGSRGGLMAETGFLRALDAIPRIGSW
jgi:hypothetical protein